MTTYCIISPHPQAGCSVGFHIFIWSGAPLEGRLCGLSPWQHFSSKAQQTLSQHLQWMLKPEGFAPMTFSSLFVSVLCRVIYIYFFLAQSEYNIFFNILNFFQKFSVELFRLMTLTYCRKFIAFYNQKCKRPTFFF